MFRRIGRSLADDLTDFAENTSAHGIPRAYISQGRRRATWLLLFLVCLSTFIWQAAVIVIHYNTRPITVSVMIKFERIAFPSVTVCNLNPYKLSRLRNVDDAKHTLAGYDQAVEKHTEHRRRRRHVDGAPPTVVAIPARCPTADGLEEGHEDCICAMSSDADDLFNCHPERDWEEVPCGECDASGFCTPRPFNSSYSDERCHCIDDYCLRNGHDEKVTILSPALIPRQCPDREQSQCLCTGEEDSDCLPSSTFSLGRCGHCDWRGVCIRAFVSDTDCICHGEQCWAVSRQRGHGKRIRVRRESSRKMLEKKLSQYDGLLAVNSQCECWRFNCTGIKHAKDFKPTSTPCICFYSKQSDYLWPCYEKEAWAEKKCSRCSTYGECFYTEAADAPIDCFCAMHVKMCVRIDKPSSSSTYNTTTPPVEESLVNFWEIVPSTTPSPMQKKKEQIEKALGFATVKDPIAIKALAKENLMYAVDKLSEAEKQALSYVKTEFITKCSFNGRDCSIENDFNQYVDPHYGNCFTYNYDPTNLNRTSERAGPANGLRFQVFVDVSDYLPTTEASGVRLTVHSPTDQPFPDTLGYSAPTGLISSFGIKLKQMERQPAPYGSCLDVKDAKDENYIYKDRNYHTEGCQRSCIQKFLVTECGCCDPRYPPYLNHTNCRFNNDVARECLANRTRFAASHPDKIGCGTCAQPCQQMVYSMSYSAARWPSAIQSLTDCPPNISRDHCLQHFREHGAMIEVYFEQLNFEALKEEPAYEFSSMLSDFGGQLGLWMGVSVITMSEVLILLFDILTSILCCGRATARKISSRQRSINGSFKGRNRAPNSRTHSTHHVGHDGIDQYNNMLHSPGSADYGEKRPCSTVD